MRRINILYWVFTVLLVPLFGIGSIIGLTGNHKSLEVITSLGYPEYLSAFLCIAKILALIAILVPKFSKLKEWAYAGLVFDVIGATYSILMVHHSFLDIIFPIMAVGLVFTSYFFYHKRIELKCLATTN